MQNLNARDPKQQAKLLECREWHHGTHLMFVKQVYETQIKNGGHAHIEQPATALSWGRPRRCLVCLDTVAHSISVHTDAVAWIKMAIGNQFAKPPLFSQQRLPLNFMSFNYDETTAMGIALLKAMPKVSA